MSSEGQPKPKSEPEPGPLKRLGLRTILWASGLSILILLDEFIKEGYFAKLEDFLKPGTHENILTILWTVLFIIIMMRRKKNGNGNTSRS